MALAEVKTIYESNVSQVPETLRKNALNIENGKHGNVTCAVMVLVGGDTVEEIKVFGMGKTDYWHTLGVLQGATAMLTRMIPE